jgi:hypothetical protein
LHPNAAVHHSKNCALMSQMGQELRIGAVRNISALPPRADVGADIVEPPVSANKRHRPEYPFAWLRQRFRGTGVMEYFAEVALVTPA